MHDDLASLLLASASALQAVEDGAASIEQAFLSAGQGLGLGLDTFNAMSGTLADVLASMQGGRMADASSSLEALAGRLVAISQSLPRDAAVLQGLSSRNEGIGKHLDALLEHIRMMTIIASSACIEAAVFGEDAGLDSFTAEIRTLTASVRTAVSRCARDHGAITARIHRLYGAQTALDRDFRDRLLVLARELSETFTLIHDRQVRSRGMAAELQSLSSTIAQNAGAALMALQSGDTARQRLEHVARALRLGQALARGEYPGLAGLSEPDARAALLDLHALQSAQIVDATETFASEAREIDTLLYQLGTDAARLASDSREILGNAEQEGGSFLTVFRGRLADASTLVATCDRARHDVAAAMVTLRAEVKDLSRTIADLQVTTGDLIVVGINAGLRAARLGADGRSLMVIADELKRLASLITEAATQLVGAYDGLVEGSRSLDRDDALMAEATGTDMLSIATSLQGSDRHMSGFVETLQGKARQFEADMTGLRTAFQATIAAIAGLQDDADAITAAGADAPTADSIGARHVGPLLWPHYTMVREREVHVAVLGGGDPTPVATRTEAGSEEPDEFLFAEAV